jgi:hypothetical protein
MAGRAGIRYIALASNPLSKWATKWNVQPRDPSTPDTNILLMDLSGLGGRCR